MIPYALPTQQTDSDGISSLATGGRVNVMIKTSDGVTMPMEFVIRRQMPVHALQLIDMYKKQAESGLQSTEQLSRMTDMLIHQLNEISGVPSGAPADKQLYQWRQNPVFQPSSR